MQIVTGTLKTAERVVIYGAEGVGKSTLASKFPRPIFMDCEGSTARLDVARTPTPDSWARIMQLLGEIKTDRMGFQTLVIDTIDWAQRMCVDMLCARDQMAGIESWGYGKGYTFLAEEFGRFLDALTKISTAGMHVVLLAHAATRKFELPEEDGQFDKWEMKLEKKVTPLVKEWATMVLFATFKTIVIADDKTKKSKAHGSKRVLRTEHAATWDAKNRHGLVAEIALDYAQIAHLFGGDSKQPAPTPAPTPATAPPAAAPTPPPSAATSTSHIDRMRSLMAADGVTDDDVMAAIIHKGYFPQGTKLINLPKDFVEGRLIANWPKVVETIKTVKEKSK